MPQYAPPSGPELVRALLSAVDRRDAPAVASFLHENATLVFGNDAAVVGRAAIAPAMDAFLGALAGIRHEITALFTAADDEHHIVARSIAHYELPDGARFSLPCCSTFRLSDGKVVDYQIYMDVNPVAAGMQPA